MKITCEDCKMVFSHENVKLKVESVIFEKDNARYYNTFYNCPQCGVKFCIMLDNEKTVKSRRELDRQITKIKMIKAKGKNPSPGDAEKIFKIKDRLRTKHDALKSKYASSFYKVDGTTEKLQWK